MSDDKEKALNMKNTKIGMKRIVGAAALLLGTMGYAASASAATLPCTTKVTGVAVAPGGTVLVTLQGIGTPKICELNSTMIGPGVGSISPEVCKAWVSMFLTAKASGQNFSFIIDYGTNPAPASCQNLASFNYAIPDPFPYWVNFGG